ncbi:MAG: 2OG-Fe(II) oxygenase [Alphaproteobacteria bacterium]
MTLVDLEAFRATQLVREPFDHLVVTGMLRPSASSAIRADFPEIREYGLLPAAAVKGGPSFHALLDEIRSDEFSAAFSEKFGLDLAQYPLMITVRGRCRAVDGRIHTDSEDKVVTALLYLNDGWSAEGGNLRLLRNPQNIDDVIAEVPPRAGTLVAFRRTDCSWHGHKPFEGERRYVMFNWMRHALAARREVARHHLSTWFKRLAHG